MKRVDFAPGLQDLQAVLQAGGSRVTHGRGDTLHVRHHPPLWVAEFTRMPPRQRFPLEFHATLSDGSTVSAQMRRPVSHHLPAHMHNMAVQAIKTQQRQEMHRMVSAMHGLHEGITVQYLAWSQTPRGTAPPDLCVRVEVADGHVQEFVVTKLGSEDVTWRVACRPEQGRAWMLPVLWHHLPDEVVLHLFTHVMNDAAGHGGGDAVWAAAALARLRPVDRRADRLALAVAQCASHQAVALVESDAAVHALVNDDTVSLDELPARLDALLRYRRHVEVPLREIVDPARREVVLQALGRCQHLQTLVIRMLDRGNSLSAQLAMLPAIAMANDQLNRFKLDLGYCSRLQPNDIALLMTLPLTSLDVNRTRLSSAQAAMLTTHAHLEELDLSGNSLDDQACMLVFGRALEALNLADNQITDAGVEDLSRNGSLRVLGLSNNMLTSRCAPVLAAMLLVELDLSRNPLGDDGMRSPNLEALFTRETPGPSRPRAAPT